MNCGQGFVEIKGSFWILTKHSNVLRSWAKVWACHFESLLLVQGSNLGELFSSHTLFPGVLYPASPLSQDCREKSSIKCFIKSAVSPSHTYCYMWISHGSAWVNHKPGSAFPVSLFLVIITRNKSQEVSTRSVTHVVRTHLWINTAEFPHIVPPQPQKQT